LYAPQIGLQDLRQGLDGARLGGAGQALQQDVAVAQQGQREGAYHLFLADDRPGLCCCIMEWMAL